MAVSTLALRTVQRSLNLVRDTKGCCGISIAGETPYYGLDHRDWGGELRGWVLQETRLCSRYLA
jgi:hypothetical protein